MGDRNGGFSELSDSVAHVNRISEIVGDARDEVPAVALGRLE